MISQPSSDFTQWLSHLRKMGRRLLVFSAIATLSPVIVWLCDFMMQHNSRVLTGILCVIEALAIVCLLLLTLQGPNRFYITSSDDEIRESLGYGDTVKWMEAKSNALRSLGQFRIFWSLMWLAWFFLYVALSCRYLLVDSADVALPTFKVFGDIFHAIVIFMALLCYLSLSMPESVGKGEAETVTLNWPPWTILFFLILVLQVGANLIIAYRPDLFDGTRVDAVLVALGIDLFHSALSGLAMALLFGRLDSKFLKTPLWFLVMMDFYAAIHITYAFFGKDYFAQFEFVTIGMMLIFKVFLFLFVSWMFNSGRLLFYFMKVQQIQEHEDRDWAKFQKMISCGLNDKSL